MPLFILLSSPARLQAEAVFLLACNSCRQNNLAKRTSILKNKLADVFINAIDDCSYAAWSLGKPNSRCGVLGKKRPLVEFHSIAISFSQNKRAHFDT